jgi:hypothetical protein
MNSVLTRNNLYLNDVLELEMNHDYKVLGKDTFYYYLK